MGYDIVVCGILLAMLLLLAGMVATAICRGISGRARIHEMALLVVLPVYQFILVLCFFLVCGRQVSILVFGVMVVFFSIAVDIVVIVSLDHLEENRVLEERLAGMYRQRQLELDFYVQNRENVRKMDAVKSGLLQQIALAESMLEEKKGFGEVKILLNDACRDIQKTRLNRYCENLLVNSILTAKEKRAREKGIDIGFGVFVEKEIPMDPVDLCSLFCNLLDNAIEACERICAEGVPKRISVKADCRAGCLILQIENTSDTKLPDGNSLFPTSKLEKAEHGLGLKLVERIVKKYHGNFYIRQQRIYIVVDTILNLSYEEEAVLGGQNTIEMRGI